MVAPPSDLVIRCRSPLPHRLTPSRRHSPATIAVIIGLVIRHHQVAMPGLLLTWSYTVATVVGRRGRGHGRG